MNDLPNLVIMRVVIASRIYEPEPSAASFRLSTLARVLSERDHDVEVLTVTPPRDVQEKTDSTSVKVSRWPVKRDKQGYVRGYFSYLSFDVPLFFRLLFATKPDAVIVEPPPTTGFFVRLLCALRKIPYAYYVADIWSDAAQQTSAPRWITRIVRGLEKWAWKGAQVLLSVSPGVTQRVNGLIKHPRIATVGNGVDASRFIAGLQSSNNFPHPYFVYAGTASEWHGAQIFIDAFAKINQRINDARLVFIGGGSEREELAQRSRELSISDAVHFFDAMPAEELAPWLKHSIGSLASVRPGSGYDFAFPTKLYSSAVCGATLIYSGPGPAIEFVQTVVNGRPLGVASEYDVDEVAQNMLVLSEQYHQATSEEVDTRQHIVQTWAVEEVSLTSVAERVAVEIERMVQTFFTHPK